MYYNQFMLIVISFAVFRICPCAPKRPDIRPVPHPTTSHHQFVTSPKNHVPIKKMASTHKLPPMMTKKGLKMTTPSTNSQGEDEPSPDENVVSSQESENTAGNETSGASQKSSQQISISINMPQMPQMSQLSPFGGQGPGTDLMSQKNDIDGNGHHQDKRQRSPAGPGSAGPGSAGPGSNGAQGPASYRYPSSYSDGGDDDDEIRDYKPRKRPKSNKLRRRGDDDSRDDDVDRTAAKTSMILPPLIDRLLKPVDMLTASLGL